MHAVQPCSRSTAASPCRQLLDEQLPQRRRQLFSLYSQGGAVPLIPNAQSPVLTPAIRDFWVYPTPDSAWSFAELANEAADAIDVSGWVLSGATHLTCEAAHCAMQSLTNTAAGCAMSTVVGGFVAPCCAALHQHPPPDAASPPQRRRPHPDTAARHRHPGALAALCRRERRTDARAHHRAASARRSLHPRRRCRRRRPRAAARLDGRRRRDEDDGGARSLVATGAALQWKLSPSCRRPVAGCTCTWHCAASYSWRRPRACAPQGRARNRWGRGRP